jgi:hypothetical protein
MRGLLIAVLIVGLGYVFLRQKESEKVARPLAAQSVASSPALTPVPRGQASQYNYMKRAVDRASDVRDQARARTQEAQDPN